MLTAFEGEREAYWSMHQRSSSLYKGKIQLHNKQMESLYKQKSLVQQKYYLSQDG